MASVGYATLDIIPSMRGIDRHLTTGLSAPMTAAGTDAGKKLGGGMRTGLIATAGRAFAPVAAAGAAFAGIKFFKGAIDEASGLEESLNALRVTYGKNADGVMKLGETSAQSLGLSNLEFNNLAVRFSGFASTIAGKGGNVVGTLDELTGRASDFASVMNIEVADAAALFQSGLAGETEPLRQFGIDLSAAAVEAHAYKTGIAAAGDELSENQKVQARYSLLMKETSQTQGDFANTSDSLANSQRRLGSSWDNIKAKVGSALLPALADGTDALADFMAGLSGKGGGLRTDGFLGGAMDAWVQHAGNAWGALEEIWGGIKKGWSNLSESIGNAFDGNGGMFDSLLRNFGKISGIVYDVAGPALAWLAENGLTLLGKGFEFMSNQVKLAGNVFFAFSDLALNVMGTTVEQITDGLSNIIGKFVAVAEAGAALGVPGAGKIANDLKAMQVGLEGYGDVFKKGTEERREALAREAYLWNLTGAEADRLKNRVLALPSEVQTLIKSPGIADTVREITQLGRRYELTPDEIVTFVQAQGTKFTMREISQLQRRYDLTPEQVVTLMKQSGAKATAKDVQQLQRRYDLTPKQVTTFLRQSGGRLTMREVASLHRVYKLTPRQVVTLLKQTGKEFTARQVNDLIKRYNLARGTREMLLKANNQTGPAIAAARRAGEAFSRQTYTATLNYRQDGRPGLQRAQGGYISGPGTATSDSIPAWLSNGEYVVRAAAVQQYGVDMLHAINARRFADGGAVGRASASPAPVVAGGAALPGRVQLVVGERSFDAYVVEIADSRISDYRTHDTRHTGAGARP